MEKKKTKKSLKFSSIFFQISQKYFLKKIVKKKIKNKMTTIEALQPIMGSCVFAEIWKHAETWVNFFLSLQKPNITTCKPKN